MGISRFNVGVYTSRSTYEHIPALPRVYSPEMKTLFSVPVLAESILTPPEGQKGIGEARESTENCDRMGEGSSMADSCGGENFSEGVQR